MQDYKSRRQGLNRINQTASGLDKRQCTLQVCIRGDTEHSRTGIILRGAGKHVSQDEKMYGIQMWMFCGRTTFGLTLHTL